MEGQIGGAGVAYEEDRFQLEAKERQEGISFDEACEKVEFDVAAFEDLRWRIEHDPYS